MRLLLAMVLLIPELVWAMHLSPMEQEIVVTAHETGLKFYLQNSETSARTVKIEVFKRTENSDGLESRVATGDFAVANTHLNLAPGAGQEIVLRYRGRKDITSENAYRLVISDVAGALRIKLVASLYARPAAAKADLQVVGKIIRISTRKVQISIHNRGRAHQKLNELSPELSCGEPLGRCELTAQSLASWQKDNVLAGLTRTVTLETEKNLPSAVDLSFSLTSKQ